MLVLVPMEHQRWLLNHGQWTGQVWRCNKTQARIRFTIRDLFISPDKDEKKGHICFLFCPTCRRVNPSIPEELDSEDMVEVYSN